MNWPEMTALSQSPDRVQSTAKHILAVEEGRLTSKAEAFLIRLSTYDGLYRLSGDQLERLYRLRERTTRKSKAGRYVAGMLVRSAWERRFDLPNFEDEEWLDSLVAVGPGLALSDSEWRGLFRICKMPEIDLMDPSEWIELR